MQQNTTLTSESNSISSPNLTVNSNHVLPSLSDIGMKSSELLSSQSQDSFGITKRSKEKIILSSYHTAPYRYLKRSPQDLGLRPSQPLNQK